MRNKADWASPTVMVEGDFPKRVLAFSLMVSRGAVVCRAWETRARAVLLLLPHGGGKDICGVTALQGFGRSPGTLVAMWRALLRRLLRSVEPKM